MDSVVLAADSSSASASIPVSVQKIEWASAGILRVCLAEGPSFFVRDSYLPESWACWLAPGACLSREASDILVHASRVYLAERCAMGYLSRSEHCRFQLAGKLRKKEFSEEESAPALDFLETCGYLDDKRFSEAWLRSRTIHQCEGRSKLFAGLLSRGVPGEVARAALDVFYLDADEAACCRKAAEKLIRQGKDGRSLVAALARKGFSGKTISRCLKKDAYCDESS